MKQTLHFILIAFTQVIFAQDLISFESSEGFTTGNIDGQQGWTTTYTGTGTVNISGQTISTEQSVGGTRSLKLIKETAYGTQQNPVIGAFKTLSYPITYTDFTLSFDIRLTEQTTSSSDFEFQTVGDGPDGGIYVIRLKFAFNGTIQAAQTTGTGSSFATTTGTWNTNTWYRVRIEGSPNGIEYFINDTSIYSGNFFSNYNFDEIRFTHDNWGGNGFIDRIAINNEAELSVNEPIAVSGKLFKVFPNPTTDYLLVDTAEAIEAITIYNLEGRQLEVPVDFNRVDVGNLSAGTYMIQVTNSQGTQTEKFIKK